MIALDRLEQITPPGMALANKALAVALQQLSVNPMTELPDIAAAATAIQTCSDLPLVNDLESPVSQDTADYFAADVAAGSGPNGTFVISDFFGTLAGITGLNYIAITNILSGMDTTVLQQVYSTMLAVTQGTYGTTKVTIPPGLPGSGSYASRDEAVSQGLVPVALLAITSVISLYPFQVKLLNNRWAQVDNQPAVRECLLQQKAGLDWSTLSPNNASALQSWISDLPNQGLDMQPGGSHWFLQSIANIDTLAGQSIIGTLREGVNQASLSNAGVNNAALIPTTSAPVIITSEQTGNS